jgi:hypothetical protein
VANRFSNWTLLLPALSNDCVKSIESLPDYLVSMRNPREFNSSFSRVKAQANKMMYVRLAQDCFGATAIFLFFGQRFLAAAEPL